MDEKEHNLNETLRQLKEEVIETRKILSQCKKGLEIIIETGNTRVAEVFLKELNKL